MKLTSCYVFVQLIVRCYHDEATNEDLKEEIEAVAKESRSLAKELAEMLLRLEVQDLREEAVESAVIGDNKKVQEVLNEMVARIHTLEEASKGGNFEERNETLIRKPDKSNTEDISESVEHNINDKYLDKEEEILDNKMVKHKLFF